ncbi:anti-sigma factor [Myxosarcina sp. GI1]|uniref:anti-sigma factor family protein n=1 Tax=Myxosarcina sp. GI1 TaxID=1541065 RepID=UPI00068D78B5|nr:zf-HC2 domain-containing protein [Myxosarcina sp. GI1]
MTSDFDRDRRDNSEENNACGDLDCFELLSAYLDGELSPAERNEIQRRLDSEPETQKMYARLLQLQSQMQHLTAPSSELSTEDLSLKVFQGIDRTQRRKKVVVWSGSAIAAAFIALISGIVPGSNSPALKLVKSPSVKSPIMLAVAVDKPAVKIPKAAVATPQDD